MNLDEYRAIIAQQAQPQVEQPKVEEQTKPTVVEEPKTEQKEEVKDTKIEQPTKIEIDGKELTVEEIKNGMLRQSDYTKKTQDLARQRKEAEDAIKFYESLKENPQLTEQIKKVTPVPSAIDPNTSKVIELENKMYDMMLEMEIEKLQTKYPDFEAREVLSIASEKGIVNLEDAYLLSKSTKPQTNNVDVDKLKNDLRKEILAELDKEREDTKTIITTNGDSAPVITSQPTINEAEKKVARMMKMSENDYVKWRDAGKKK